MSDRPLTEQVRSQYDRHTVRLINEAIRQTVNGHDDGRYVECDCPAVAALATLLIAQKHTPAAASTVTPDPLTRPPADLISAAARTVDSGKVQLFVDSGAEWLPAADHALVVLLHMLSNAVWHEDVNHQQVLSPSLRVQVLRLAAAIERQQQRQCEFYNGADRCVLDAGHPPVAEGVKHNYGGIGPHAPR